MSRLAGPALVAAALHLGVLLIYVAAFHEDVSALVCLAREHLGHAPYEQVRIGFERNGYDGQYYYALAQAPWRRHDRGIDLPAIRQARILYPALSWLVSGGDARRLLWVMPLINVLAIAFLAALGAWMADGAGLSPWWGVLLPFAVNAGMPLLRNLTDALSALTVAALLIAWLRRWPWWLAGLCAAAALFSREQNVLIVLLVLVCAVYRGERRWIAALLAAGLTWAAWLGVLRLFYGAWPLLPSDGNVGLPLTGMLQRWSQLPAEPRSLALFHLVSLVVLSFQLGLALWLLRTPVDRLTRAVALAGAALALLAGWAVYGDNWSYPRVFAWLPLGLWLACVQLRWRWSLAALSSPALLLLAVLLRVWLQPLSS